MDLIDVFCILVLATISGVILGGVCALAGGQIFGIDSWGWFVLGFGGGLGATFVFRKH